MNFGLLLAVAISFQVARPAAAPKLYRIELAGNQTVLSRDRPVEAGGGSLLLFHRYPDGLLLSVKKAAVRRVTVSQGTGPSKGLRPGGEIVLGPTGSAREPGTATGAAATGPYPGERQEGTALLNPDRTYRPEWDNKLVPGATLPYPPSANDYREGRTFAYPPASGVQQAPGAPPTMPQGSGEPPKGPS
jgi:hypothetical protein